MRAGTNSSIYYRKDKTILPTVAEIQELKNNLNESESPSVNSDEKVDTDCNSNIFVSNTDKQNKTSSNKEVIEVKAPKIKENILSQQMLSENRKKSHPNLFEGVFLLVLFFQITNCA